MSIDPEFYELNRDFMAKQRHSVSQAASLAATAREITAAAELYERLPKERSNLAAGLESLKERLDLEWLAFITKVAVEAANAPQE